MWRGKALWACSFVTNLCWEKAVWFLQLWSVFVECNVLWETVTVPCQLAICYSVHSKLFCYYHSTATNSTLQWMKLLKVFCFFPPLYVTNWIWVNKGHSRLFLPKNNRDRLGLDAKQYNRFLNSEGKCRKDSDIKPNHFSLCKNSEYHRISHCYCAT